MTHRSGLSLESTSRRPRRGARALLAAAAAVLALAAAAAPATAAPSVTLTHSPDLVANPTVGVSGAGWGSTGFYLAQVAIVGDEVIVGSSQKWVKPGPPGSPFQVQLQPDGTFETSIAAEQVVGEDPDDADCAVEKCFIATWPQHTEPTPDSIFTKNRLYYAPEVEVDPAIDIAATGQTVAVRGGGIPSSYIGNPPAAKGILVAQIAVVGGQVKTPSQGAPGVSRYIRASGTGANKLNANGTFDSDLTLSSILPSASGAIDCTEVQCEVAVWEGQSFPANEAALLARTPIDFGPGIAVDPATDLSVLGQNVLVDGIEFDPIELPNGLKASLALIDGSDLWRNGTPVNIVLDGNDAFEDVPVPVAGLFIKPGGQPANASAGIDCIVRQCSIVVWNADVASPTPADVIASRPVSFQQPSATVTPMDDLSHGQTVTVSGSGFSPAGTGAYVSQVALVEGEIVTPPPVSPNIMQWVRPVTQGGSGATLLKGDGSFDTEITVSRTFKAADNSPIDCTEVQCSIIAWRGHTNPTPETLYTSTPLTFGPEVPIDPTDPTDPSGPVTDPGPTARAPLAELQDKKPVKLSRKAGNLVLGTVRCGSTACSFVKPKRVPLRLGKKRTIWLVVSGPDSVGSDQQARFGVRISARAAKLLAGRKVRLRLRVGVRSASGDSTFVVNRQLLGPKPL